MSFLNLNLKAICRLGLVVFVVSSCGLNQNIQVGNTTGKVADNKWDYYNGSPQHYTSFQRSVTKSGMMIVNESTDAFSGNFNFQSGVDKASVEFNGTAIILNTVSSTQMIEDAGFSDKDVMGWDEFYASTDKTLFAAIQRTKQIGLLSLKGGDERTDIAFYPSRYLACKKLALMKQTKDAAVMASLVKTALVAGVQSYTSYSTSSSQGNINSQYGNFGYTGNTTTRDYSWAGDRASDALDTVFSGGADTQSINAAWNSMNCY